MPPLIMCYPYFMACEIQLLLIYDFTNRREAKACVSGPRKARFASFNLTSDEISWDPGIPRRPRGRSRGRRRLRGPRLGRR